jgi:hypothetical protein
MKWRQKLGRTFCEADSRPPSTLARSPSAPLAEKRETPSLPPLPSSRNPSRHTVFPTSLPWLRNQQRDRRPPPRSTPTAATPSQYPLSNYRLSTLSPLIHPSPHLTPPVAPPVSLPYHRCLPSGRVPPSPTLLPAVSIAPALHRLWSHVAPHQLRGSSRSPHHLRHSSCRAVEIGVGILTRHRLISSCCPAIRRLHRLCVAPMEIGVDILTPPMSCTSQILHAYCTPSFTLFGCLTCPYIEPLIEPHSPWS